MKIQITLYCPECQSAKVKKNGKKTKSGKQNFRCKAHTKGIEALAAQNQACI